MLVKKLCNQDENRTLSPSELTKDVDEKVQLCIDFIDKYVWWLLMFFCLVWYTVVTNCLHWSSFNGVRLKVFLQNYISFKNVNACSVSYPCFCLFEFPGQYERQNKLHNSSQQRNPTKVVLIFFHCKYTPSETQVNILFVYIPVIYLTDQLFHQVSCYNVFY